VTEVKAGMLLGAGIFLAALSGLGWLWLAPDRTACSSVLVSALDQHACSEVSIGSGLLAAGFFAGLAIIAWGLVIANRKS
jgi:hypothetical protein